MDSKVTKSNSDGKVTTKSNLCGKVTKPKIKKQSAKKSSIYYDFQSLNWTVNLQSQIWTVKLQSQNWTVKLQSQQSENKSA